MNKKEYLFLAITMAVILLGGCAVTPEECDPSSDGFIKGVTCKVSGGYEERIRQREETLSDIKVQKEVLGTVKAELELEHAAKSQLLEEEREEVRQLGLQIKNFQKRLDSVTLKSKQEQAQHQALLAQLADLQSKAAKLEATLAEASIPTQEYEQAKQENEQLRQILNNLIQEADAAKM